MPELTTTEEQQRAVSNYQKWYFRLQELETRQGVDVHQDPEWRFAITAEQAWASAVRRSGLPFPAEHLKLRYVA